MRRDKEVHFVGTEATQQMSRQPDEMIGTQGWRGEAVELLGGVRRAILLT